MKSKLLLSFLMLVVFLVLASPGIPAQTLMKAPQRAYTPSVEDERFGYIPPPMDLSHIQSRIPAGMLFAPYASFDWRTTGDVSPVKNQNPYGTCWCFAALGDFESKILIDDDITEDFSELNIQACNPTYNNCNYGGNAWISTNYLALLGSVDETCDSYPGGCPTPTCINPACSFLRQVTGWKVIPNTVTDIKNACVTYGPVYVSMYAGFPGFGSYDGSYCLTYSGTDDPNHAVLIVGWDDAMCGGAGAWIVKNSWGTSWGDNGYFYIQYENARIGENANVIVDYKDYDPNETIYYYDDWGWWGSVGYGDGDDWAMVVFTPGSDDLLYNVDIWATSNPTNYSIYIYDDFSGGSLSNLLAGPIGGTANEAGYYSVELPTPLAVTNGDNIYIAVQFVTPGYGFPIPYDDEGPMETNKSWINNTGAAGSWIALDAGNAGYGDIGIRARIAPEVEVGACSKEGNPCWYHSFPLGIVPVVRGETKCFEDLGPANLAVTGCDEADTFCVQFHDDLGWTITASPNDDECHVLNPNTLWWQD
ncbi:MAG: hypothetical protein JXB45_03875, partial [Candidatus Krumholzibacteriota bacterium]|nr:hypothetical protein [Candidatus Krumholzibacteriota bacterium]